MANPCLHLPMPLQSATFVVTHLPGKTGTWGKFLFTYDSGRLDEPNYLADILDEVIDQAMDLKESPGTTYPEVVDLT